jgi:competence protein ComEC
MVVQRERPTVGVVWLTAYDVGQGSALLVETATQTLLYDTGPRMGPAMDAGSRVLVPSLRARGIDRLDKLLISHADEDHIGGAATVLRDLDVAQTLASLPPRSPDAIPRSTLPRGPNLGGRRRAIRCAPSI